MTRAGEGMKPGQVQRVPRGRWHSCLFRDNGDGTATVMIGRSVQVTATHWHYIGRTYTVPIDRVMERSHP